MHRIWLASVYAITSVSEEGTLGVIYVSTCL